MRDACASTAPHPAQCCLDAARLALQHLSATVRRKKGWLGERRTQDDPMAFLFDRQLLDRANRALLMSVVGGGLVACALGASIYDIGDWLCIW
jgi:hypothetical protein